MLVCGPEFSKSYANMTTLASLLPTTALEILEKLSAPYNTKEVCFVNTLHQIQFINITSRYSSHKI